MPWCNVEKSEEACPVFVVFITFFRRDMSRCHARPYPSKVLCLYINEMTFHLQISSENHASEIRFISLIYSVLQNTSIALRFVKIFREPVFFLPKNLVVSNVIFCRNIVLKRLFQQSGYGSASNSLPPSWTSKSIRAWTIACCNALPASCLYGKRRICLSLKSSRPPLGFWNPWASAWLSIFRRATTCYAKYLPAARSIKMPKARCSPSAWQMRDRKETELLAPSVTRDSVTRKIDTLTLGGGLFLLLSRYSSGTTIDQ